VLFGLEARERGLVECIDRSGEPSAHAVAAHLVARQVDCDAQQQRLGMMPGLGRVVSGDADIGFLHDVVDVEWRCA
jgi:hypothetical protein